MGSRATYHETSWSWDFQQGTVELWTTRRVDFQRAVRRSPKYLSFDDMDGSYRLTWKIADCCGPGMVTRKAVTREEGQIAVDPLLTDGERRNRAESAKRVANLKNINKPSPDA